MSNDDINKKLDLIMDKLNDMDKRLNKMEKSCGAMDNHITFVDCIYSTIRSPLDFIVNKVSRISGRTTYLCLPEKGVLLSSWG